MYMFQSFTEMYNYHRKLNTKRLKQNLKNAT